MRLLITDLTSDGLGVGRAENGQVIMATNALPGESVRVEMGVRKKGYALAETVEVLTASPERVEPPCPYFGQCGGCQLQHLSYAGQVAAKLGWLKNQLRALNPLPAVKVETSPRQLAYRRRLRLHYGQAGGGFFARHSKELVPVDNCLLAAEAARARWAGIAGLKLPGLEEAEVLAGQPEDKVYLYVGAAMADQSLPGVVMRGASDALELEHGLSYYQSAGLNLRCWPGLFSQVNWEVNQALIANLLALAEPYINEGLVLDLFAGSGNLSLPLANSGARVWAVEGAFAAVKAGRFMAEEHKLACRFFHQPVAAFLREKSSLRPGLVVLDPPRAGVKGLVPHLLKLEPKALLYVSCHPAALARDALSLREQGFNLRALVLLDMFPQTGQMECMALLAR